jgi:hypothetical protein
MIEVVLSWHELELAAAVGVRRHIGARRENYRDTNGFVGVGWNEHIEGAAGEMAVANALDLYWAAGVGQYRRGGDVANLQVRTTMATPPRLKIMSNARPDDVYILVQHQRGCKMPTYHVLGWILARDGMQPKWLASPHDRTPAYFVPEENLIDIKELKREHYAGKRTDNSR